MVNTNRLAMGIRTMYPGMGISPDIAESSVVDGVERESYVTSEPGNSMGIDDARKAGKIWGTLGLILVVVFLFSVLG
jgi:hypothetical protein